MPATKSGVLNTRKPFKLLIHFTEEELRQFRDFLAHPPLETSGKYARKILEVFDRCRAVNIFEQQVGKDTFLAGTALPTSANAFDKLISAFYDRMQDFLAFLELKKSPGTREQLALRAYRDRDMEWKEVHRRFKEARREINKLPRSSELANLDWAIDLELAEQANARSVPPEDRGYEEVLTALETNYVTQKLRLLCAIANHGKIFSGQGRDFPAPPETPGGTTDWPVLAQMYYFVYLLIIGQENEATMVALNQLLEDQDVDASTYPRSDMLDLYGYLLNALTRQVNRGNFQARARLSQLYDHLISKGILLENGTISAEHFKNVISLKLKTGEIEQARVHFDNLSVKISNDPDHNASRYNHAILLYMEGKLEESAQALENLCEQVGNIKLDQFYGLDMRVYLLMAYFDLLEHPHANPADWDLVDEKIVLLLEAFKSYIDRRKIPQKRKDSYEDFRILMQMAYTFLYRQSHQTLETRRALLEIELQKENNSSNAAWFRERIQRIIR